MDSTNGAFMSYNHSSNDNLQQDLFDGINDFVDPSDDPPIHPDLLQSDQPGLAFGQQSSTHQPQPAQSAYNQYRQTQSQSPALPQFRPTQNNYAPQQFQQNGYNAQHTQHFDQQYAARPTPSPTPYEQLNYPGRNLTHTRPQHNYFANAFEHSRQPTTSQLQRSQIQSQQQQHVPGYLDMLQPQAQIAQQGPGQAQNYHMANNDMHQHQSMNGMMQYPYGQRYQMPSQTINPSDLGMSPVQPQQGQPQLTQNNAHQYYARPPGQSVDTKNMTMQQYHYHLQQANAAAAQRQAFQPQQMQQHPMMSMQQQTQPLLPQMPVQNIVGQAPLKKMSKTSTDAADSDSDLEITEEIEPEARPACISISKPEEKRAAFRWDLVDAVWSDRKHAATPEKIRSAVKFIGDRIRGLRDTWKEANDQLKKAENSKQQTDGLKQQVLNYREWMEWGISQILQWGHPSILKRLGENSFLLTALYSFLLDRVNADDYDSTLVVQIMKLGTCFNNVDEDQLEKVKWTKILTRFTKKCTNESKTHAQTIIKQAKEATARKKAKDEQGPASPGGTLAGVKRAREGSDGSQPAKRAVKQASKPLSVLMAEKKKLADKAAKNAPKVEKPGNPSAAASVLGVRPKPAAVLPQKANQFAGLLSAKKRPGTTNAERDAKVKTDPDQSTVSNTANVPTTKTEVSNSRPSVAPAPKSSFLDFLGTVDKPKESLKHKMEEEPDETPEVKAKRLRKEARRKLRVSWKPESELVQTRIFEHDIDEETGHEDSQTRDVGDTGKEGEMLKKGMQVEEEEDSSDDEDVMEYYTPTEVDFSSMKQKPEDDFDTLNFIKTGGGLKPDSPASKVQEEMEYGKEMTIYRPGEQPTSPKEPVDTDDDNYSPTVDFGEPNDEKRTRNREDSYLRRLQASQRPQIPSNGFNLAAAVSGMQAPAQQPDYLAQLGLASQPQIDFNALLAAAQNMPANNAYQQPHATGQLPAGITALLSQLSSQKPQQIQPVQQPYASPLPIGTGGNPNPFPGASESKKRGRRR